MELGSARNMNSYGINLIRDCLPFSLPNYKLAQACSFRQYPEQTCGITSPYQQPVWIRWRLSIANHYDSSVHQGCPL